MMVNAFKMGIHRSTSLTTSVRLRSRQARFAPPTRFPSKIPVTPSRPRMWHGFFSLPFCDIDAMGKNAVFSVVNASLHHQPSTTDHQLPTINYQPSTTNHLLPTIYYRLSTTDYLLPTTDYSPHPNSQISMVPISIEKSGLVNRL